MNNARLVAVVIGIGALFASMAPAAHGATIVEAANNVAAGGPLFQTGRVAIDGANYVCDGPLAFAPTSDNAGLQHALRLHTSRSLLNERRCLTVTITTTCGGANQIHSVSYIGGFNPADVLANFAAAPNTIAGGSATYSFYVAPGESFATTVHERNPGTGCGAYTLKWSNFGPWAYSRPLTSGAPAVGATVTGTTGTWSNLPAAPTLARQWLRCDNAGANCAAIPGATSASYTITDADLGGTIRNRITATDADGSNSSDSLPIEPFIPLGAEQTGSFGAGDRVQSGVFIRNSVESRCTAPTTAPTILSPTNSYIYDEYSVTSIVNEPACLVLNARPDACVSGITASIYSPAFTGNLAPNYAANSGADPMGRAAVSWTLPAGGQAQAIVSQGPAGGACADYRVALGTTAPFATERPVVAGGAVEGSTLFATDGAWSGAPSFAYAWLRCDAAGNGCVPIPGATSASYSPTSADAGSRVRARVTATQGSQSASVDSTLSEVISARAAGPPPGGPGPGPGGPGPTLDKIAPKATLKWRSADARRGLRRSRLPVAVTCDENCTVTLELKITSKLAKKYRLGKRTVIGTVRGNVTARRGRTLTVKLNSVAKKRLKNVRSLKLNCVGTARDTAGNRATVTRKVTLKRSR